MLEAAPGRGGVKLVSGWRDETNSGRMGETCLKDGFSIFSRTKEILKILPIKSLYSYS